MPTIELQTVIRASIPIVFDLSRSIDLHKISTKLTHEKAIAGRTSGLIELNETVTWRAKHFGIYQNLTSKITEFERPWYFAEEMVSGAFRRFKHEHHFSELNGDTLMSDCFNYESPLGFLGRLADKLFLETYVKNLLVQRNRVLKDFAESDKWEQILTEY